MKVKNKIKKDRNNKIAQCTRQGGSYMYLSLITGKILTFVACKSQHNNHTIVLWLSLL